MEALHVPNHARHHADRWHPGDLPDHIGNFALGVGRVNHNQVVVDIYSGAGGIVPMLNKIGASVIGFDYPGAMGWNRRPCPDTASGKISGAGLADFLLPVESRGVDAVFVELVLYQLETPLAAILEIKRILKPGGRLVLTDLEKTGDGGRRIDPEGRRFGLYRGDIRHWLKSAGFSNIIVNPVPTGPGHANGPVAYLMATATA